MRKLFTTIVAADPPDQLLGRELTLRFDDRPFAVHPVRLDPIQPRAFHRQLTPDDSHSTGTLGLPVMSTNPLAHGLRDVPRSIVPNQQQRFLAFTSQPLTNPSQKLCRHPGDGSALHKPQPEFLRVSAQQPVTREGLRIRVRLRLPPTLRAAPLRPRSNYAALVERGATTRPHPDSPRPTPRAWRPS